VKSRRADKTAPSPSSELVGLSGQFVRVAGEPAGFAVERDRDPKRIDHLWISVRAGRFGVLRITLNTSSLRNRDLGFDSRISVGIFGSSWSQPPVPGVAVSEPFDYATIAVGFQQYERAAIESLIAEKVARALIVEGRGELYVRGHSGIHQVHSRRASYAFKRDDIGRDGAVRFYFDEGRAEMLLFKFYGQP
jgi:hypothetical protein